MKKIAPLCLAMLSACSSGGPRPAHSPEESVIADDNTVVLDFQTGFRRTPVELQLDGEPVFSEVLTTDERVGLARSFTIHPRSRLGIDLVITLSGGEKYSYEIQLDRGHYIGISRNLDSRSLKLDQRQGPFEYD
jgi:hypothetical protein